MCKVAELGSLFCGVFLGALFGLALNLLRYKTGGSALIVLWLTGFCVSSSWCRELVCSL